MDQACCGARRTFRLGTSSSKSSSNGPERVAKLTVMNTAAKRSVLLKPRKPPQQSVMFAPDDEAVERAAIVAGGRAASETGQCDACHD